MHSKKWSALFLFILLGFFWIIIASRLNLVDILIGLLASGLIVFYSFDMVFTKEETTSFSLRSMKAFFVLFVTLLRNIVVSNIEVARIVLSPRLPIKPGFKAIRQPLKKDLNRTFYGNAITLTPGTLTVDMNDTVIIVHGLRVDDIKTIEGSKMEKVFMTFEGEDK